ncbi:transcription initiation factor TFIIF beta subunit [Talaromyces islandicus]|uniref:Transcription initiation factor IIF subunit beta n=1 Tax=Talaromyces islandicus TaxID=28573 RepID=A0A0U1M806_TALIS|nr:transcription initiation factor TFIIF beta subunit [Talaromyces islandicus]
MAAPVKQEPGSAAFIKPDPDSKEALSGMLSDEDIYEDAGDLDFSQAGQNVWLTRIPNDLWKHWSQMDEDEEIQIGTVRVEGEPHDIKRISLRLNDNPNNKDIPKDYLLQRQNVDSKNSSFTVQNNYIFSEKDLPGHKNRVDEIFGETRSLLYESMKREARKKTFKKKWEPYVRKTIPKQTAIAGKVADEFNCMPVENAEYQRLSEAKALEALKPKNKVLYRPNLEQTGPNVREVAAGKIGGFVQPLKPVKPRAQENKATRRERNILLDEIFGLFREYTHWKFADIKARLNQPEQYLKETLEMVAHLVRSGDFAMTWELKPEAKEANYTGAILGQNPDDDAMDASDNEDVQFENV